MPFFDNFFDLNPSALGDWLQREKARQMFERVLQQIAVPKRLLEIGPGRGEFADLCLAAGIEYFALEANVRQAESLHQRGANVLISYSPPLPLNTSDFDVVVAWNVIEHMPDFVAAKSFLAEMIRVTRPGGIVGINAPDVVAGGMLFWDTDFTHSFPTSMRRLRQMFNDEHLNIVDATYYSGVIPGALAHPMSWGAAVFPETLVSMLAAPVMPRERIYRTRITFLRNIFMLGRKSE